MDFIGGSECINHGVVKWDGNLNIYSRPLAPPTVRTTRPPSSPEQPPGTPLRLPTNRYDTSEEREVLGRLWEQVNVKLNSPRLPPARPVGWDTDKAAGASASTTLPAPRQAGYWTPTP